jgi:5-bromo-4-chloroindolyl phosphate hydrolysis protein
MVEKRQLNIRLPVDLYEKMSNSEESMVSIIEAALRQYYDTPKQADSSKDVSYLLTEIDFLRSQIIELEKLLHQEQSLHLQTQKQIMLGQEEIIKKNWWQFWKRV